MSFILFEILLWGLFFLSLFDAKLQPPCFAAPGDWISFKSIDSKTFEIIDKQSNQGTYQIKPYD